MKKSHSAIGKPAPDLSAINPVEVEEVLFDPNTQPGDKFNQIFKVIINPKDNQEVLKAIKIIEQIEGVQAVEISISLEAM